MYEPTCGIKPITVVLPAELESIDILSQLLNSRVKQIGYANSVALSLQLEAETAAAWMLEWMAESKASPEFVCRIEWFDKSDKLANNEGGCGIRVVLHSDSAPLSDEEFEAVRLRLVESSGFEQVFSDVMTLNNLGIKGQELVIEKILPSPEGRLSPSSLPHDDEAQADPASLSEPAAFVMRPLEDERDAVQVARCAYASYGYSYPSDIVFSPARLTAANREGRIISVVAADGDNRIIGHTALELLEAGDRAAEIGMAFVHPDFRSQGLLGKMTEYVIRRAQEFDLDQLYVIAVTEHLYSQKAALKFGFIESALRLGVSAPLDFREIKESSQRLSVLVQKKRLTQESRAPRYIPPKHWRMIHTIYGWHGESPELIPDAADLSDLPSGEERAIRSLFVPSMKLAQIEVLSYGSDTISRLRGCMRELVARGVECETVTLALKEGVDSVMKMLELRDFLFGGIQPLRNGEDGLLMQCLFTGSVDISSLKLATERGLELAEYIDRHRR